jgi:hypothetical protein
MQKYDVVDAKKADVVDADLKFLDDSSMARDTNGRRTIHLSRRLKTENDGIVNTQHTPNKLIFCGGYLPFT